MASDLDIPSNQGQRLRPGPMVSLYQLDVNPILRSGDPVAEIVYWVSAFDNNAGPKVFRGMTYQPMPVVTQDFAKVGEGKLPRPKLQVSNIEGTVSELINNYYGLTGARLKRLRTFEKYLDDGPAADPLKVIDVEIWRVGQPTQITRTFCEFELYLPVDLENVFIPKGRILERCRWVYRDPETCTWSGAAFDINNFKAGTANYNGRDECAKALKSCIVRFQDPALIHGHEHGLRILPFGGFPGTGRPVR